MASTSCTVCTELFNEKKHKQMVCANCHYEACIVCVKQYLLGSNLEPHCMNCKHEWNREFLDLYLPHSWINGALKKHLQDVLWDRERSLMPATQEAVEFQQEIKTLRDIEIPQMKLQIQNLQREFVLLAREVFVARYHAHFGLDSVPDLVGGTNPEFNAAGCAHSASYYLSNLRQIPLRVPCTVCTAALKDKIPGFRSRWTATKTSLRERNVLCREMDQLAGNQQYALMRHFRDGSPLIRRVAGAGDVPERRQFVAACPSEDCRGFLSNHYKCGVCQKQFCSSCRELKGEGHVCDPALVETIKAILKDSSPCPACGTSISKIDGCDQMYCTLCFTAFSYKTGQKVTGVIHNPHYYQRMRSLHGGIVPPQGGGAGDPCIGEITMYDAFRRLSEEAQNNWVFSNAYRLCYHVEHTILDHFPRRSDPTETINAELRVKYLTKVLSEKQFKQKIQANDRIRQKKIELRDVYELFLVLVKDFFTTEPTVEDGPKLLEMIEEFVNQPLREISERYKNRVEIIDIRMNKMIRFKKGSETGETGEGLQLHPSITPFRYGYEGRGGSVVADDELYEAMRLAVDDEE